MYLQFNEFNELINVSAVEIKDSININIPEDFSEQSKSELSKWKLEDNKLVYHLEKNELDSKDFVMFILPPKEEQKEGQK